MTDQGPYRFYKSDGSSRRKRWIWIGLGVVLVIFIVWLIAPHGDQTATPGAGGAAAGGAAGARAGGAGAAGGAGGRGGGRGGRSAPSTVGSARATSGDVPVYLDELGTVTPAQTVTVRTQISGQLFSVGFKEGELVKKGQLLALIDPRPYEQALLQAEGNLARDQATLEEAKVDLNRYETLLKQDSIARQQVDTQRATVHSDEGVVKTDQAAIAAAKLNLIYCHITSPVAGRVGLRQVDPGNYVTPSDTNGIVVVTELDPIDVIFTLPEDNLSQVSARVHSGAVLQAIAFDRTRVNQLGVGQLLSLDNQVDTTTGTVRAKARFANGKDTLFPNEFVNIRLMVDTLHNTVVVPTAAVLRGAQGLYVWVVDQPGNTVEMRTVKIGPAFGDNTAVTSGLDPGEIVVTDGSDRLRDNQRVFLQGDCIPARRAGAGGQGGASGGAAGGGQGAPQGAAGGGKGGASGSAQAEEAPKTLFNLWGLIPSKPKAPTDPMAAMRCKPGERPGGHVGDASTAGGGQNATASGSAPAGSGGGSGPAAGGAAATQGAGADQATPHGRHGQGQAGDQASAPAPASGGAPSGGAAGGGSDAGGQNGGGQGGGGHMSARLQAMLGPLNLDAAQQAKVSAIAAANQPKIMAAFQSGDMQAGRAAAQAMNQQIEAVLRPDQKAKFEEIRAQRRAQMQGGGGGPQ